MNSLRDSSKQSFTLEPIVDQLYLKRGCESKLSENGSWIILKATEDIFFDELYTKPVDMIKFTRCRASFSTMKIKLLDNNFESKNLRKYFN